MAPDIAGIGGYLVISLERLLEELEDSQIKVTSIVTKAVDVIIDNSFVIKWLCCISTAGDHWSLFLITIYKNHQFKLLLLGKAVIIGLYPEDLKQ